MPLLRITKKYNNRSPLAGIIEVDKVQVESREAGERFITATKCQRGVPYDIIDWEYVLIDLADGPEIIENPTGGRIGKM